MTKMRRTFVSIVGSVALLTSLCSAVYAQDIDLSDEEIERPSPTENLFEGMRGIENLSIGEAFALGKDQILTRLQHAEDRLATMKSKLESNNRLAESAKNDSSAALRKVLKEVENAKLDLTTAQDAEQLGAIRQNMKKTVRGFMVSTRKLLRSHGNALQQAGNQ